MKIRQVPKKLGGGAVVVLSGGQDSTTSLFWALQNFLHVEAIFLNYGQRHAEREIKSSFFTAKKAGVKLTVHHLPIIKELSVSALTSEEGSVLVNHPVFKDLPATFVPLRNMFLLTTAASFAVNQNIWNLVTGVCQTDYSGYPDCRQDFISSLQDTINSAFGVSSGLTIWTPLMSLTKAETVVLATTMPGCMEALQYSHTCYEGLYPPCGMCPACILRAKGFDVVGIKDPLLGRCGRPVHSEQT